MAEKWETFPLEVLKISEPVVVLKDGMKLFVEHRVWIGWEGRGRANLLILMNLKRLLYRVNIHKCLLSNHSFTGLSWGFSNMFKLMVVGHPLCFCYHLNHFTLRNHCSKDDKYQLVM